jgi:uncharacterized protein (TIGR02145 family)
MIGNQIVMAENLAYKPGSGSYWVYDDDQSNLAKYGYLYDWETAQTVAPLGWHLPTKEEWESLCKSLGGDNRKVYKAVKEGGGSGFDALLAGAHLPNGFDRFGKHGGFWSATPYDESRAFNFYCYSEGYTDLNRVGRTCGFSVRLFKD